MNIYFNELSLDDNIAVNNRQVGTLARIWAKLRRDIGLQHFFCIANIQNIVERMGCQKQGLHNQVLYSMLRGPYIDHKEDIHTNEAETKFLEKDFYLLSETGSRITKCDTLGWTIIQKSIFVGIETSVFWSQSKYNVEEVCKDNAKYVREVLGITTIKHFDDNCIKDWFDENFNSEPEECKLPSSSKARKDFPDHHGRKELNAFADKLLLDKFVVEIVNSIPHQPNCDQLVLKMHPDGMMDICLYWTVAHYAMRIRTTAKNRFQMLKIKRHIENEYGGG